MSLVLLMTLLMNRRSNIVCTANDLESSVVVLSAAEMKSLESAKAEVDSVCTALGLPSASELMTD